MPARLIYTKFVHRILVEAIACGCHLEVACKAAHISRDTLERWLERGRKGDAKFRKLVDDVEQAEFDAERLAVDIIRSAAAEQVQTETTVGPEGETVKVTRNKDWRAAAWLLEHRFAMRWAQLRRLAHSGQLDTRQHVVIHEGSVERAEEVFDEASGPQEPDDS